MLRADEPAQLFIRTIYQYRVAKKFLLHEFVAMHDHIHLIITPNDILSAEKAMQLIKGRFSFEMGKKYPKRELWQRSFTLHRIEDEADYRKHRDYIHQNPVTSGYVKAANEFAYSSANPRFKIDPMPQSISAAKAAGKLKGHATHG